MQWKMASSGRFSERLNRWAIRRGFPILSWIAPRLPLGLLHAGASVVISIVMFFHSRPKRAIARNLARVLGEPVESPRVRRATTEMLRHFACSWADLFRYPQLPAEKIYERVVEADLSTLDPLRAARDRRERTILLTAHLGNWEIGAVMIGLADVPLAVVYVPDAFAEAEQFRGVLRGLGHVEQIPIQPSDRFASLKVLRAFERGAIVALQGDRDFNDTGVEVQFFGGRVKFPVGPFHLARITGARLLPAFVAYAPDGRFEIVLGDPIEVPQDGDRDEAIAVALARWVEVLERAVRRWPTQWYTFYDFWPQPVEGGGA